MSEAIEPWLRGILPGVHPVTGHLIRAAQHICEDLEHAIGTLSLAQLWAMPEEMTSVGFHAKHLAGSTHRLCTYLEGQALSPAQLAEIPSEQAGTETPAQLTARVNAAFKRYTALVEKLPPEDFGTIRYIGRQRLQTTAIGLAIHIAEHGQRHAGQAITAAKLARATQL